MCNDEAMFFYLAEIEGSCNEVQGEVIVLLSTPFEALLNRNYLSRTLPSLHSFRQCFKNSRRSYNASI